MQPIYISGFLCTTFAIVSRKLGVTSVINFQPTITHNFNLSVPKIVIYGYICFQLTVVKYSVQCVVSYLRSHVLLICSAYGCFMPLKLCSTRKFII